MMVLYQTIPATGQTGYGPEVQIGMARMHFQPNILYTAAQSHYTPAYGIGGNIDYPVTGKVYLQAGLLVSRKGDDRTFSYATNDSFHESVTQKLGMAYAELPLGVTLKTGTQGRGRCLFTMGLKPGYVIYGTNKIHVAGVYAGASYDTSTNTRITNGNPVYSFDMALILSAGYELPTGWYFRFTYAPGINDIGLGGEVDKNRTLYLSCGRIFGKNRDIRKEEDDLIDHTR